METMEKIETQLDRLEQLDIQEETLWKDFLKDIEKIINKLGTV